MFTFENLSDGELVHQRCLLITGNSTASAGEDVLVSVRDEAGRDTFPAQHWPLSCGHFKALVFLSPGINVIGLASGGKEETTIRLNYVPLLQFPPLHLAILVARDSPLLIDCPPGKYGGLSSTHSGLEAAIAKFRMTAYMWQALTAEDMRAKGLGRRSFRLDERWGSDTVSQDYLNTGSGETQRLQATAHIHIIKTEMTVAELRDKERAQQNPNGRKRDELHQIFSDALKAAGGEFESQLRPVVAGLILDSHYSMSQDLVLAHAALGSHNAKGLSLGVMGSHLTYSWPRFLEEVPDCLLDVTVPGEKVCNDNGECLTLWEACAVGQGAFLHAVGHAFSAPHTSGIMQRGYSQNWPKCFLAKTAHSKYLAEDGIAPVTAETPNDCRWDIRDAMRFVNLPHFAHPADKTHNEDRPAASLVNGDDQDDFLAVEITSSSGIVRAWLNDKDEALVSVSEPRQTLQYTLDEFDSRFDVSEPAILEVLCVNGKGAKYDLWRLFAPSSSIGIPGTSIRLIKDSSDKGDTVSYDDDWSWTVMLKKRSASGALVEASKIDLRVGCGLDGAIVYYKDGTHVPCGPRQTGEGYEPHMGGHQARKMAIPRGDDIVKVRVSHGYGDDLCGLRMHLASGKAMGALNKRSCSKVTNLQAPFGYRIVGFYGKSGKYGMCREFGIISAHKDIELPDSMYDMRELQNIDGKLYKHSTARGGTKKDGTSEIKEAMDWDPETSEDEDDGYDEPNDW